MNFAYPNVVQNYMHDKIIYSYHGYTAQLKFIAQYKPLSIYPFLLGTN